MALRVRNHSLLNYSVIGVLASGLLFIAGADLSDRYGQDITYENAFNWTLESGVIEYVGLTVFGLSLLGIAVSFLRGSSR